MVGAGAQRAGIARPDAARLSRHALGQGRPGADRGAGRGIRGRVQRPARLCAGAGAAHRARSGRGEESGADAALRQEPDPLGRAGRALRRGRRASRGAGRASARAGRHHQSGQERDPGKPSAVAWRVDALARQAVHRFHGESRSGVRGRLEPHQDAVRAGRAAGQDHRAFHQRRGRHQQGVPRRPRRGGGRCAGARCVDRRGLAPERARRRQRLHLAQGGGRDRQESLARRVGQVPQLRRDAAQSVSRDPRPDEDGGSRQRHHDARTRAARASR